jgi:glycosyltransferase involved in cell wall biosynthesis
MHGRMSAVGVVIPVHNESKHVRACLRAVRVALRPLVPAVAVSVVLDRCEDDSPALVAGELDGWPVARAVTLRRRPAGSGVGFVRSAGLASVMRRLYPARADRTWLLSTDADTVVPPNWAIEHLRHADTGAHGVAGLADLDDETGLSRQVRDRYRALLADRTTGTTHRHVYGANLGMRADAYQAAGGFPTDGPGEDRRLWHALSEAGYRLVHPMAPRVRTSARRAGRAQGGLADLLSRLDEPA